MSKTCDTMLFIMVCLAFALSLWTFLKVRNLNIGDLAKNVEDFSVSDNSYQNFGKDTNTIIDDSYANVPSSDGESDKFEKDVSEYSEDADDAYQQKRKEINAFYKDGKKVDDLLKYRAVKNQDVSNHVRENTSVRDRDALRSGCAASDVPQFVLDKARRQNFSA